MLPQGLFVDPIMGARREGALGALKGLQRGIMGLAVKPATGAIDFATQTIGGIVSQARAAASGHIEPVIVSRRCVSSCMHDVCVRACASLAVVGLPSRPCRWRAASRCRAPLFPCCDGECVRRRSCARRHLPRLMEGFGGVPRPRTQLDAVVLSVVSSAGLSVGDYLHHVILTREFLLVVTTSFASLHSPMGSSAGTQHWRMFFNAAINADDFFRLLSRKARAISALFSGVRATRLATGASADAVGEHLEHRWATDIALANAALTPFVPPQSPHSRADAVARFPADAMVSCRSRRGRVCVYVCVCASVLRVRAVRSCCVLFVLCSRVWL